MTPEKYENMVKDLAHKRIQNRIRDFKLANLTLMRKLFGSTYINALEGELSRKVFSVMASENNREGWPGCLWEREEKTVSDEILSTLDVVQQALICKEPNPEIDNISERSEDNENSKTDSEELQTPDGS